MKLTILGKYGPYPQGKNGACSGYLITQGDTKILVDCGTGVLGRLMEICDLKTISAIYLTHLHFDHTSDLLPMRYLLDDLNHTLKVYTHLEDTPWAKTLLEHKRFEVHHVDENTNLQIGELKLEFYKMQHTVTNHGVLITGNKRLGITGDTVFCDNVLRLASKSDYLLADCSKPIGFKGPHMSADKALEIVDKTGVKILATHVTPYQSPDEFFNGNDAIIAVEELKTYEL